MKIINIEPNDRVLLDKFLHNAGDSLNTFRYFNSRQISALDAHIITALLLQNDEPLGYGHLDQDGNTVWLGIAIAQKARGLGFGNAMMSYLIDQAKKKNLKVIKLSVDIQNVAAISLYNSFGFLKNGHCTERIIYMELHL